MTPTVGNAVDASEFLDVLSLSLSAATPGCAGGLADLSSGIPTSLMAALYQLDTVRVLTYIAGRAEGGWLLRKYRLRATLQSLNNTALVPLVEAMLAPGDYVEAFKGAWVYQGVHLSAADTMKRELMDRINRRLRGKHEIVPLATLLYILERRDELPVRWDAQLSPQLVATAQLFLQRYAFITKG